MMGTDSRKPDEVKKRHQIPLSSRKLQNKFATIEEIINNSDA